MKRLILLLPLLLGACDSNTDAPASGAVLVANQGNFSDANGSISRFSVEEFQASTPVTGLGTILQSLYVDGETLYAASNTAGRIDVFDAATLQRTGQISGLPSPRYMVRVGGKLYVTNLFASTQSFSGGSVSVIDLAAKQVVKTILVGDNPEGIVAVGNRLFVANHGFGAGSTVSVLDAGTDAVLATVNLGCEGPRTLAVDAEREVWVVCTGRTLYDAAFNMTGHTPGALIVLDGTTGAPRKRIGSDTPFGAVGPGQDAFYRDNRLYVVKNERSVLRVSTVSNSVEGGFAVAGDPIGAIAHDGAFLYLGRVPGYTTAGAVSLHGDGGTEVRRYTTGVAPAFITFAGGADGD